MKRRQPTPQEIADRATGRRWRNDTWTFVYRWERRQQRIWLSVFLLLIALFGGLLFMALLYMKYGGAR